MDSPLWTLIACVVYFSFAKVIGPRAMENRKPFELRAVMTVYNIVQIIINGWVVYVYATYAWWGGNYKLFCQPVDYSSNHSGVMIMRASYCFLLLKFFDFCDTIFFVLRKKSNQITWLHLLHHAIMPIGIWPGVRFVPGGHGSFAALFNSVVHFLMYFYYFLAGLGTSYRKFLFWKKYLTLLQMTQFIVATLHSAAILFMKDCHFPAAYSAWIISLEIPFFFLFLNFYLKSYVKKNK